MQLVLQYIVKTLTDFARAAKHTKFYNCSERISIAEHWKLVAESSEFHLMLSRAHLERIFSDSKFAKKRDILSHKRESGMTLKKHEFMPESGADDTYEHYECRRNNKSLFFWDYEIVGSPENIMHEIFSSFKNYTFNYK